MNNQNFVPGQPIIPQGQSLSPTMGPPVQPNFMASSTPATTPAGAFQPAAAAQPTTASQSASLKKDNSKLILTIVLIIVSLAAVTFLILFIYMYTQWDDAKTNVDGQISEAVATAVNTRETELQTEFEEKEKYPYKILAGPEDYGSLTLEYPKTWSVYVAQDGTKGNYEAYLNPDQVQAVNANTVMALRVTIQAQEYENVLKSYETYVKNGRLIASVRPVNGINATIYEGQLPNRYNGFIAVIKIRDKTAVLQSDAEIFKDDFFRVVDSVKYNT